MFDWENQFSQKLPKTELSSGCLELVKPQHKILIFYKTAVHAVQFRIKYQSLLMKDNH